VLASPRRSDEPPALRTTAAVAAAAAAGVYRLQLDVWQLFDAALILLAASCSIQRPAGPLSTSRGADWHSSHRPQR